MTKTTFISLLFVLFIPSCKVTKQNAYGHFDHKNGINTYFYFDTSGHFSYMQRYPLNSLLKKTDYIVTEGVWAFDNNGYLTLNSSPQKQSYKKVEIEKTGTAAISSFTFYDISGDTLPISGATKNGQWFGRVHNLIKSFELKLQQGDTITADLLGYDKFIFHYSDTLQSIYHVKLFPNYIPDYFYNKKLLLKRNKIFDPEFNETYKKKSGM